MKISLILYIIILALLSIILFSGCSEDSPAEPDSIIHLVSGEFGNESFDITHVGLFDIEYWSNWGLPLGNNDTSPLVFAPISGKQWTLDITDINDQDFYLLLGWNDIDGDDRYDPLSGETPSFLHLNNDTLRKVLLSYFSKLDTWSLYIRNPITTFPLFDYKDQLFLFDDSKAPLITSWIANDSTFSFISGSAQLTSTGINIRLTGVDSTKTKVQESNLSLSLPSLATRAYSSGEFFATVTYSFGSSGLGSLFGNLGLAGISFVDTVDQKRVRGWLALYSIHDSSPEKPKLKVYGTFDLPIVP